MQVSFFIIAKADSCGMIWCSMQMQIPLLFAHTDSCGMMWCSLQMHVLFVDADL